MISAGKSRIDNNKFSSKVFLILELFSTFPASHPPSNHHPVIALKLQMTVFTIFGKHRQKITTSSARSATLEDTS